MSPVVRLTPTSFFDDSRARAAMARYCDHQNWAYEFGDTYAKIDMFTKKLDGTYIGLELACNACWTTQLKYPEPYIHIPWRKWKTFYEQIHDVSGVNMNRAKRAYFILFNTEYKRAAIMSFSSILEHLALFKVSVIDIYDKPDIFVHVPISYIQKYIDIPHE